MFSVQNHGLLSVQPRDVRRPLEAADGAHHQDQAGHGHGLLPPAGELRFFSQRNRVMSEPGSVWENCATHTFVRDRPSSAETRRGGGGGPEELHEDVLHRGRRSRQRSDLALFCERGSKVRERRALLGDSRFPRGEKVLSVFSFFFFCFF